MAQVVIFGAGKFGRQALSKYKDKVAYFIDNNPDLINTEMAGYAIHDLDYYVRSDKREHIIIASKSYQTISKQLTDNGITDFETYEDLYAYNITEELVYNPYENERNRNLDEDSWNREIEDGEQIKRKIVQIREEVERLSLENGLFDHVEIETINRCNGMCDFCPVNAQNDKREFREMTDELFAKIIDELSQIEYSGKLALFSNNEPLLDKKIVDRHYYARRNLPNARMHLFTNGTLMTIEIFKNLMECLDELIIDNYSEDLRLIKPCEEIRAYCENHNDLKKKVTIVLRNPHEILTTRGGDAPNRKKKTGVMHASCVLPFKQMIIRPDGRVSLCCNDPLGKNTMGDLRVETILDVWNGNRFREVRNCLLRGRVNWQHCNFCDALVLG